MKKNNKLQTENIKDIYYMLKEERIVTNKDVALEWIEKIGKGYDGAESADELRMVIDELIAYAILGKECIY